MNKSCPRPQNGQDGACVIRHSHYQLQCSKLVIETKVAHYSHLLDRTRLIAESNKYSSKNDENQRLTLECPCDVFHKIS
jgi:hypothetical protein